LQTFLDNDTVTKIQSLGYDGKHFHLITEDELKGASVQPGKIHKLRTGYYEETGFFLNIKSQSINSPKGKTKAAQATTVNKYWTGYQILQVEHQKEIDKYYDSMPKKEGKVAPKAFVLKTKEYIEKHGLNFNPHRYATKKSW